MATGDISNFRSGNLRQGSPLGQVDYSTMLVTSGTNFLMTQGYSMIHILSTTTTAANAVFTLQSGFTQFPGTPNPNNTLTLVFEAGSSFTAKLVNSGNCKLTADWTPTQYQTLTLLWDSALGFWVEITRTPASIGGTALANGQIFVGNAGGVATGVAMSGDATISNTGVVTVNPAAYVTATGSLTQANLIAMHTTPVQLLAAPGAGLAYFIQRIEFFHSYSTAAYTGGGTVQLEYDSGATVIVLAPATLVTGASSSNFVEVPTIYNLDSTTGTSSGFSLANASNKSVTITNNVAVFAAGNVANILKWRLTYALITILT